MRKVLLFIAIVVFSFQLQASPVDVEMASQVGSRYAKANAKLSQNFRGLTLAHTFYSEDATPTMYVFNTDNGFVVVAADDVAQPILAYSNEGQFDINNMPDGYRVFLNLYTEQITYAVRNGYVADQQTAAEWRSVLRDGTLSRGAKSAVEPLLTVHWNQDWPFNAKCPEDSRGPGGHAYAGCVATTGSALMKFWNYPEKGNGSHSYTSSVYGPQSVDFSQTTFDWENMPVYLYGGSTQEQIDAVSTLMYNVAVAVDMQFNFNGSASSSIYLATRLPQFFDYTINAVYTEKNNISKTDWQNILIACLDEGFPIPYSGAEGTSGHSFMCDGYDENRLFHFDFGWSGSGNAYFDVDAITFPGWTHFNDYQTCVTDLVPKPVYNKIIPAVGLDIKPQSAYSHKAMVTWRNPIKSIGNETITSLDKVVVKRNGVEIFSQENLTIGEYMSFEDEVDDFGVYEYTIRYESNGIKGREGKTTCQFGPACTWKIIGTSSNFQGWSGGALQVFNDKNQLIKTVTMTNSTPISTSLRLPEGNLTFKWVKPKNKVPTMSITIKNSNNEVAYSYSGSSDNITSEILYSTDNTCYGCEAPEEFEVKGHWQNGQYGALITWNIDYNPTLVKIYCSRTTEASSFSVVGTANPQDKQYFDPLSVEDCEAFQDCGFFYKISAFSPHCESEFALAEDLQNDYIYFKIDNVDVEETDVVKTQIYPNPVNDKMTVEGQGLKTVVIYNIFGQQVVSYQVQTDKFVVETSSLAAGIYFVKIEDAAGLTTRKITVAR